MSMAMGGWLVISVGLLGAIVALGLVERRRFLIGLGLAGLIVLIGLVTLTVSSLSGWRSKRHSERLRQDNVRRLEQIRSQFRELPATSTAPVRAVPPPAPRTAPRR